MHGRKKPVCLKSKGDFLHAYDTPSLLSDVESPVRANFPDGHLGEIGIQIPVD
jgi:hypothetical protein